MHTSTKVFAVSALVLGGSTILAKSDGRLMANNRGYSPEQPLEYSHRLHAGELGIDCLYCHYGAERGRHAGIPSSSVCMNCHAIISSGFDATRVEAARAKQAGEEPVLAVSPELRKLFEYAGWDPEAPMGGPGEALATPIPWQRIHQVPDFVYFDHSVHVAAGQACETCHGPVQSMERMRQYEHLSMGWCVNCHRDNEATPTSRRPDDEQHRHVSTDCITCHL